ncbi:hypothetical protein SAMN04489832_2394 [Micromonospora cremea]|uniref:Uncharacterized protein n=1 Tax=Micromonospora cremea TaxID=709881 RepID=A0A1N5WEJ6_9ACTN|nr:hypothetical protein SAMN04489832_2394 [Micromonospora cremea]
MARADTRGVPGPTDTRIEAVGVLRPDTLATTIKGYEWQPAPPKWDAPLSAKLRPFLPTDGTWQVSEQYAADVRTCGRHSTTATSTSMPAAARSSCRSSTVDPTGIAPGREHSAAVEARHAADRAEPADGRPCRVRHGDLVILPRGRIPGAERRHLSRPHRTTGGGGLHRRPAEHRRVLYEGRAGRSRHPAHLRPGPDSPRTLNRTPHHSTPDSTPIKRAWELPCLAAVGGVLYGQRRSYLAW